METLCEFRAGKLASRDNVLSADPRKGLLRVALSDDGLTHVQWFERDGTAARASPEDSSVVFSDECELQQIPGQARCLVLRFPADPSRDAFFWLQGGKAEDDQALLDRFNAATAGRLLLPAAAPAATAATTAAAAAPDGQKRAAAATPTRSQATPAAGSAAGQLAGAAPPRRPEATQAAALAALLSSALATGGAGPRPTTDPSQLAHALMAQLARQQQGQQGRRRLGLDEGPGLHEVLRPELLAPLLRLPGVLEQCAPHLPEEHRSMEQLVAVAHSPQFRQQLATFSSALQTGQLDLAQFGLQAEGFSVADFLEAIQRSVAAEQRGSQPPASGTGTGSGAAMEF
ncbi:adhesion molecule [Haematococcus lacustris]